ncbi:MAG: restriction endonuclease [Nitrospirae bacterium]|nr:restriction endonuclease [Nitrospirota bacterium]
MFVRYFGPVLDALRHLGGSARPSEVREQVASKLELTEETQTEVTSNGMPRFDNQVAWARFYLAKAGLIDASRRGVWSLTDKGRSVGPLTHGAAVTLFREVHAQFHSAASEPSDQIEDEGEEQRPPEGAASTVSANHREQVLDLLRGLPAAGFERFCQRLLRESGFQQVTVTGKSRDGGIDGIGILQVNALVSFKVLFQCKKYAGVVSPSQVRDFRGAMMGRADKGIILTTGTFTVEAKREALRDGVPAIELVDGEKLVGMLEEIELGLSPVRTFSVDVEFFDDFRA